MRFIEELRNIYQGKEIWILCTGHTLDDYPDEFFEDKISIRLNWSMVRFPITKDYHYIHWYHSEGAGFKKWVNENHPEFYPQVILPIPQEDITEPSQYGEHFEEMIWVRWNKIQVQEEKDFQELVQAIVNGYNADVRVSNTVTHTAIEVALIMGAKQITLSGCSGHSLKHRNHAGKGGMDEFYKDDVKDYYVEGCVEPEDKEGEMPIEEQQGNSPRKLRHKKGILWLANSAEPFGIKIVRHFYKTGYKGLWEGIV